MRALRICSSISQGGGLALLLGIDLGELQARDGWLASVLRSTLDGRSRRLNQTRVTSSTAVTARAKQLPS
jgi:hypothetical protein